jgi:hypothetical protein
MLMSNNQKIHSAIHPPEGMEFLLDKRSPQAVAVDGVSQKGFQKVETGHRRLLAYQIPDPPRMGTRLRTI